MNSSEKIIISCLFFLLIPAAIGIGFYFPILSEKQNILREKIVLDIPEKKSPNQYQQISYDKIIKNIDKNKQAKNNLLENPPDVIKAVYLTSWSAGSEKYTNSYLSNFLKDTEINALVIDIKDYSGFISYEPDIEIIKKYKTFQNIIPDIKGLIKMLHQKNIYLIARVSVFQDPALAKIRPDLAIYDKTKTEDIKSPVLWRDNNGLFWLDPASEEVLNYNVLITKDAAEKGFDEINFDYVRFPSDGETKNMGFPFWDGKNSMNSVIKDFFKNLRKELPNIKISADIFGQTTTNYDDLGIGQIIEDSLEYFDFVCPMVYPSHFANGFMGFENPAEYPYEIVKYSIKIAMERKIKYNITKLQEEIEMGAEKSINLAKIRPWLQDFSMGAIYTEEMVKEQIEATKDGLGNDYNGFMLWNPSNIYHKQAVLKLNE